MTKTQNDQRAFARDYRCRTCGRLLFRGYLTPGCYVVIRCWHRSCATDNEIIPPHSIPVRYDPPDEIVIPVAIAAD